MPDILLNFFLKSAKKRPAESEKQKLSWYGMAWCQQSPEEITDIPAPALATVFVAAIAVEADDCMDLDISDDSDSRQTLSQWWYLFA